MFFKALAAMVAADVFDRHMREKQYERWNSTERRQGASRRRLLEAPLPDRGLAVVDWSAPERPIGRRPR